MLFPKGTPCDKPVPDPLPAKITIENDQDSFYVKMFPDPPLVARGPVVVALQLQTATGENHYIRLKVPFPPTGMADQMKCSSTSPTTRSHWLSGQPTACCSVRGSLEPQRARKCTPALSAEIGGSV